jgi:transposase
MLGCMPTTAHLDHLSLPQLRELVASQLARIQQQDALIAHHAQELRYRQAKIDKLTHELAIHKRWKFGRRSEQLPAEQASLLDESLDADVAAIEAELEALTPAPKTRPKNKAKRQALPPNLPRTEIRHEPDSQTCSCGCALKRIGEDVSEKLDYTPGVFTVERHVRGKWVCNACKTLEQAPVPPHVIDKGIPTPGLLAHSLVSKFDHHLPLYRLERIYGQAGVPIPQSTLGAWVGICGVRLQPLVDALRQEILKHTVLHADETPVQMLAPGNGKTHRAYLWAYAPSKLSGLRAVVYAFAPSRSGEHARDFLGEWKGKLVCDDFSGYKASFSLGITEIGCMAHSRRKFFELQEKHQSELAGQALRYIAGLYEIEREARDVKPPERLEIRQQRAGPILSAFYTWLVEQRRRVPDGSAIARAIDYSLKRWPSLVRYLDDPAVPIDNNHIEGLIRPVAIGRSNWLFTGSQRAGERAAAIMSLIQTAKLNGHDPYAYLKDVLTRLPTQKMADIAELLPHRWAPTHINC